MKTFITTIISFLFYQITFAQNLKIELFNKTNCDLDSVAFEGKFIGSIKKGQSVIISDCKEITLDNGFPYRLPIGIIKNTDKKRHSAMAGFCGTGRTSETSGDLKFDITVSENESGYMLWWDNHK